MGHHQSSPREDHKSELDVSAEKNVEDPFKLLLFLFVNFLSHTNPADKKQEFLRKKNISWVNENRHWEKKICSNFTLEPKFDPRTVYYNCSSSLKKYFLSVFLSVWDQTLAKHSLRKFVIHVSSRVFIFIFSRIRNEIISINESIKPTKSNKTN